MKTNVRAAIKRFVADENMEESNEDVDLYDGDDDALNKVLLQIQKYLRENEFEKALQLLTVAQENWSESEDLQVDEKELDDLEEEGSKSGSGNSEDSESTPIVDSDEDTENKRRMLKYEVILQWIYKIKGSGANGGEEIEEETGTDFEEAVKEATQPEQPEQPEENVLLTRQRELVMYLKSCLYFSQQMNRAIPVLCQLFGSKSSSDVLELIDFFIVAHEFGLAQSAAGIRKMANLIWSRDPVIKKAVVAAFERLYMDIQCENERNKPTLIVNSLMSLLANANLGELTSLEELVCELMKMELIPQSVVNLLWQKFALKIAETTGEEQRSAVVILSMIAGAEKDIIKSNLSVLVEHGLSEPDNLLLARDTCSTILKLSENKNSLGGGKAEPFRLPSDHQLFSRLELLLSQQLPFIENVSWTPFCEQAIKVIYNLAEYPDTICSRLLKCLIKLLMGTQETPNEADEGVNMQEIFPKENGEQPDEADLKKHPTLVARVLFAVGQVALLQLYHLDVSIFSEMKRRNRITEEENEKKGQKKTPGTNNKKNKVQMSASKTSKQETMLDDEMGVGGATAEDAEAEYIRKLCELEIVTGSNLISFFAPLIITICSNRVKYNYVELQSAATLALAKFMLVSSAFCDKHIQLLFTILEKSEFTHIRSNIVITLGDLALRFPNIIEPWTPHMYARLRDESTSVRKTTVGILSHLILNDMVKVKGQISEMAVCLEDTCEKIINLAKMFFFELSQKGNALYNIVPDVISRLSDPVSGIEEKKFRSIMKYLLQFMQKDKQGESLVEKLCHRFRTTKTERQSRDLSYCLSVLPYNEKVFKKLQENISCYRTVLCDDDVYANFTSILSASRKFSKPEFKVMIDEFEQILLGYHTKTIDEDADPETAANVLTNITTQGNNNGNEPSEKTKSRSRNKQKPSRKTNTRHTKAKKQCDDSDSSDDVDENRAPVLKSGSKRPTRSRAGKVAVRNQVFSSDEEDVFK